MGPEETEKSIEEMVDTIKRGDLSLAPKLYEQTKGIICYVVWREWRREHIRRGAKARGMEVEDLLQEGYFMMIQSAQLYDSSIGASFKAYLFAHIRGRLKAMTASRKVDDTRSLSEPFGAGDDAGPLEEIVEDPTALRDFAAVEDRDYLERLRSDLNDSIEELSSEQADVIRGKYIESRLVKDLASDLKIAEKDRPHRGTGPPRAQEKREAPDLPRGHHLAVQSAGRVLSLQKQQDERRGAGGHKTRRAGAKRAATP